MTDPNVGLAVVNQKSGLGDETQEEATLDVDQNDREDDTHQGGQQFATVGNQRF